VEKIQLEILGLSSSQAQIGSFALVLGEKEGDRRLPIIIGGFEAQAIALEIENIKPNRPMTHDLIISIAREFEINLQEVVISDLREGVFYSRLVMYINEELHEIDARPSDAIAIAVRYRAPIFTYEHILNEAGIVIKESDNPDVPITYEADEQTEPEVEEKTKAKSPKSQQIKKINQLMEEAIQNEDYERAAKLRDELQKLENS